jgi:hypothetical protein
MISMRGLKDKTGLPNHRDPTSKDNNTLSEPRTVIPRCLQVLISEHKRWERQRTYVPCVSSLIAADSIVEWRR